ncbi:MAG: cytochrome c [Desulfurivibrionaceae bacterium]|jgi:mono/diheme cytochrome c family protein|nr:cytochrome c [Desulfurivibrionaceae bacterium]
MKWRLALGAALSIAMLSTSAMADEGATMFKQKCGACHVKGGQATPVNPADKAGIVWKKFFTRGRHKVDFSPTISGSDLQLIVQYLQDHAADSDQPAVAVIPK